MKNKILVTGANGYIGRHIVDELVNRNYQVIAADIMDTGINKKAEFCKIPIFSGDDQVFRLCGEPDVCIHLAWQDGFVHNAPSHILNISKHYQFLSDLINGGCKNIAVMGTMHEVGYWEGMIDESTPCNPLSLYGVAKNALRQSLQILNKTTEFNLYWLRAYYILGDDIKNHSIFSKILQAVDEGKKTFPFTSGKNQYDFIDVKELAGMIVDAALQDEYTGVINVCSGEPVSLAQRVETFIEANQLDISLQYGAFPDRVYDSPIIYGDNKIIKAIQEKYNK